MACAGITPVSDSVFPGPSPLCLCGLYLLLSFYGHLSWDLRPTLNPGSSYLENLHLIPFAKTPFPRPQAHIPWVITFILDISFCGGFRSSTIALLQLSPTCNLTEVTQHVFLREKGHSTHVHSVDNDAPCPCSYVCSLIRKVVFLNLNQDTIMEMEPLKKTCPSGKGSFHPKEGVLDAIHRLPFRKKTLRQAA